LCWYAHHQLTIPTDEDGLYRMAMPSLVPVPPLPNKRLKLTARVDYGMNLSSARRSLSAIR